MPQDKSDNITDTSREILKFLNGKGEVNYKDLSHIMDCSKSARNNDFIQELRGAGYIKCSIDTNPFGSSPEKATCKITINGKAYLDAIKKDSFRFWLPNVLSIAAISIALISLIVSVIAIFR